MTLARLIYRNMVHYWRTNLAVVVGVATAVSVLSGALSVGESVRTSLQNLVYQRLGGATHLVSADHFFREDLASGLEAQASPIIYLQGVVVQEQTGVRALDVKVYGINERFWKIHAKTARSVPQDGQALVGAPLAEKLGAKRGDTLLLSVETQHGIPRESLYGRRENVGRTIRLECSEILPSAELGEFALRPNQGSVYSVFVPLARLQRDLEHPERVNAILVSAGAGKGNLESIQDLLATNVDLQDLGVKLRSATLPGTIFVESPRMLLDEPISRAAFAAATAAGLKSSGVFTYLANAIRAGGREIPYSVITAAELGQGALTSVKTVDGTPSGEGAVPGPDPIWLNSWAATDLGIVPGKPFPNEAVEIDYYVWQDEGRLRTRTARFRLAGIVEIGGAVNADLTPDYPGITEARSISDWDPPFPVDLRRIRPQDEEYWNRHKGTPKAFITLASGQELWRSRYGNLSAVCIAFPSDADTNAAAAAFARDLRARITPRETGFSIVDLRERGLAASRGTTDFGEYFLYFSFFLIVSAVLLAALFFRLGVEQRARELGTLRALGFPLSAVRTIFLVEGAILATAGSLLGLLGAVGYGALMVYGLRTWWVGAVGTRSLFLAVSWTHLVMGAAAGILVSLTTIFLTLRGLRQCSPRALLAGVLERSTVPGRRVRSLLVISSLSFIAAGFLLLASVFKVIADAAGFFGAGLLLLISVLGLIAIYLKRTDRRLLSGQGWTALVRLGARNTAYRPGRSLLCVALIAGATFIIVSTEAFRRDPQDVSLDPASGTGGFPLLASSSLPILHNPNTEEGREALGISVSEAPELEPVKFVPFRMRPGDDTSCLNLYAAQDPKVLGVPHSFIPEGRFSFQDSLAKTADEKRNPWLLLEREMTDGAVPAIADANTIQYILRLSLGSELVWRHPDGTTLRLRLVAALRDSVFQGELLVSDAAFLRLFPEQEGFRFFLLDLPPQLKNRAEKFIPLLEKRLAEWSFSVESTQKRLASFNRVENTYLSTFQSLGALGLVLGTIGLATVLLRNVLERRKELALLRAVGYRRLFLSVIIVSENVLLVAAGLACGFVCASLAILPALAGRGVAFPAATVGVLLAGVLLVGLAASVIAVRAALRSNLLAALRSQ
ncbi:MAG: FtsX-like permease family protein [Acidobacteriota bacterium]